MPEAPREADQVVFLTYGKANARPTAHRLSHPEALFLRALLSTGNKVTSAKEAGMSTAASNNLLQRPEIAQYIEERLLEQAAAAGVTREKVLFAVNHLLENPTLDVSQAHLKAIDIAAKILKMVQPNLHLHQNAPADSPFVGMDDQKFMEEFQKRMAYRGEPQQLTHDRPQSNGLPDQQSDQTQEPKFHA